jgi:hypothetical protein
MVALSERSMADRCIGVSAEPGCAKEHLVRRGPVVLAIDGAERGGSAVPVFTYASATSRMRSRASRARYPRRPSCWATA